VSEGNRRLKETDCPKKGLLKKNTVGSLILQISKCGHANLFGTEIYLCCRRTRVTEGKVRRKRADGFFVNELRKPYWQAAGEEKRPAFSEVSFIWSVMLGKKRKPFHGEKKEDLMFLSHFLFRRSRGARKVTDECTFRKWFAAE
jgi:hypothetical protein